TDRVQHLESAFRIAAQRLNRISVGPRFLTLDLRQRDALQARFLFQNAQGISSLNALDLLCIPTEDATSVLLLHEPKQFAHLPAGYHAGLIEDQYPAFKSGSGPGILKQSFDGDRARKADPLEFFDRAHGGCDRKAVAACLLYCTFELLKGGRFA